MVFPNGLLGSKLGSSKTSLPDQILTRCLLEKKKRSSRKLRDFALHASLHDSLRRHLAILSINNQLPEMQYRDMSYGLAVIGLAKNAEEVPLDFHGIYRVTQPFRNLSSEIGKAVVFQAPKNGQSLLRLSILSLTVSHHMLLLLCFRVQN